MLILVNILLSIIIHSNHNTHQLVQVDSLYSNYFNIEIIADFQEEEIFDYNFLNTIQFKTFNFNYINPTFKNKNTFLHINIVNSFINRLLPYLIDVPPPLNS